MRENKPEKERKSEKRREKGEKERKREKRRRKKEKMSRVNYYQSAFNSQFSIP